MDETDSYPEDITAPPFEAPGSPSPRFSSFWPVAVLGASFLLVLIAQIVWNWNDLGKVADQEKNIAAQETRLKEELEAVKPNLEKAETIKKEVQSLAEDLIKLAEKDADAKAIVAKYNIRQGAPATAPAATPAP